MSIDTQANKDSDRQNLGFNDPALFTSVFKLLALLIANLPEDDQADMIELLHAASQADTAEEMDAAEETVREILRPKTGQMQQLALPKELPASAKKWAEFSGKRLREIRKASGMTQEELAAKAELPQPHISRMESGEISPTRHTIEKLAKALGKEISDFDPTP